MKRGIACALLCAVPAMAAAQSLGELARKERERRKKNQESKVEVRVLVREGTPADALAGAEAALEGEPLVDEPAEETETAGTRSPAGPPAPSFRLPDRNGRVVSLAELRGRPVLLDFWATWCAPCRATMPHVEALHRKYGRRGLQVVGINIEGKSEKVLDYLQKGGYSFLVLFDAGNWQSAVARSYGVSSIPRTVLIDAEGNVVFSGHPQRLPESVVESLLGS